MKKVIVNTTDRYVIALTEEEYEQLKNGEIGASELLNWNECVWVNGTCDWEE